MKKIICVVLALFIYANTAFGYGNVQYDDYNEYKSKYRILYGALLVIGGAILTYDGFRTVKVDKSKPAVNMNFSSWWYRNGDDSRFELKSEGDILNTGNVNLTNITVRARYRTLLSDATGEYYPNAFGKEVTFTSGGTALSSLAVGDSANWTCSDVKNIYGDTTQPEGRPSPVLTNPDEEYIYHGQYPSSGQTKLLDIVSVDYSYQKKYKEEMNNAYEGILGLLLVAGGAYLLIDYVISLKKFDYYMKKNNMNFYVENDVEEFTFKLSKKL